MIQKRGQKHNMTYTSKRRKNKRHLESPGLRRPFKHFEEYKEHSGLIGETEITRLCNMASGLWRLFFSFYSTTYVNHEKLPLEFHCSWKIFQRTTLSFCLYVLSKQIWMFQMLCFLLSPADHSAFHTRVTLCLSATLIILALAAGFLLFKVDLLLAYRKLFSHFAEQQGTQGYAFLWNCLFWLFFAQISR